MPDLRAYSPKTIFAKVNLPEPDNPVNTIKQMYAIVTDNRVGDFGLRWLATIRLEDS